MMKEVEVLAPLVDRLEVDAPELPGVTTHDAEVERFVRIVEAERSTVTPSQPAPRPSPRRAPYGFD